MQSLMLNTHLEVAGKQMLFHTSYPCSQAFLPPVSDRYILQVTKTGGWKGRA